MTTSTPYSAGRLLLLLLAVTGGHLRAQTPADAPVPVQLEVVSIRPHQSTGDDPSERRLLPGGRFVVRATTAGTLMRMALGTEENRMSGATGWVSSQLFDIDATTMDHAEVKTSQQLQGLLLALLADRFQFKFHREQKDGPVYWLELEKPGKVGPALKPSAPEASSDMSMNTNSARTQMKVSKMTMTDVAAGLRKQVGRPVEDHTDLKGNYDFSIEWSAEDAPNASSPSLFTVLKEQLGLKLRSEKGSIETVVIDRIEQPSEN